MLTKSFVGTLDFGDPSMDRGACFAKGSDMQLHHVAVIVSDLDRSALFYEQLLGLEREPRSDLGFPGLFYGLGNGQQLHLMQIDDPCDGHLKPEHGGRDHHFALAVDSLDRFVEKLEQADVTYTMSRSGRAALFCRDPDGNAIEIIQQL